MKKINDKPVIIKEPDLNIYKFFLHNHMKQFFIYQEKLAGKENKFIH